jgi:hypothetical protein
MSAGKEWGTNRHSVGPAIRELVALGLVGITEEGRAGNDKGHKATRYRLTYVNNKNRAHPTNEWRGIKTVEEAEALAEAARAKKSERARVIGKQGYKARAKKHFPVHKTDTDSVHSTDTEKAISQCTKPTLLGSVHKTDTTIYNTGRAQRRRRAQPAPVTVDRQPDTSPRGTLYQVLPPRAGGPPGLAATRWPEGMSPPSPRCAACSRPLSGELSDSRFCSAECRQRHALGSC